MDISNMTINEINNIDDDNIRELALREYEEYFAYYRNLGINSAILEQYYGETINFTMANIGEQLDFKVLIREKNN